MKVKVNGVKVNITKRIENYFSKNNRLIGINLMQFWMFIKRKETNEKISEFAV